MKTKESIIVITGPTATGKTKLGVALAQKYNGEVISADSMQIYKGLDITTAKPTVAEMQNIPHHFISILEPDCDFSTADYVRLARAKIIEIIARGKMPIIVGGTGLYISSLLNGVNFENAVTDGSIRERLTKESEIIGNIKMHERLSKIDPETAALISPNNIIRVIRALEIFELTGIKFSEYKIKNKAGESPYNSLIIGLNFYDRADLYERINLRVDNMLEMGLIKECQNAYNLATNGNLRGSYKAIGYKELIPFFENMQELEVCVDKIKQNTRRYAKRQLTWFRQNDQIEWVYLCKSIIFEKFIDSCEKIVAKSKIICYN